MKKRILDFVKMHGAGNDFVVFDCRGMKHGFLLTEEIAGICDRRFGIGADGVLLLCDSNQADYRMMYKNADGSDAGMCGNGARCLALYAGSKGFGRVHHFISGDVVYKAEVLAQGVTIHFPMVTRIEVVDDPLEITDTGKLFIVHAGTEHVVALGNQALITNEELLREHGKRLRNHSLFMPLGTNVNFMTIQRMDQIRLRTYERGVEALTLACGTGAVASSIAAHHLLINDNNRAFIKATYDTYSPYPGKRVSNRFGAGLPEPDSLNARRQFDGPQFDGPQFDGPQFEEQHLEGSQLEGSQLEGSQLEVSRLEERQQFEEQQRDGWQHSGWHRCSVLCDGGTLETGFQFNPTDHTYSGITLSGPAVVVFEGTINL